MAGNHNSTAYAISRWDVSTPDFEIMAAALLKCAPLMQIYS